MKREKIWIVVFSFVINLVVSGCGPEPIKLYSGPELPDEQIATLSASQADIYRQNLRVDGQPVNADNFGTSESYEEYVQIRLAPGLHEIQWARPGGNWTFEISGTFEAKPGHIYDAYFCYHPARSEGEAPYYIIAPAHPKGVARYVFEPHAAREPVADYAAWIQDRNTGEVVVGAKPAWGENCRCSTRAWRGADELLQTPWSQSERHRCSSSTQ